MFVVTALSSCLAHTYACTKIAKHSLSESLLYYIHTHTCTHMAPLAPSPPNYMQPAMCTATQERPCVPRVVATAAVAAQWPLIPDSMGKWAHSAVRAPVGPPSNSWWLQINENTHSHTRVQKKRKEELVRNVANAHEQTKLIITNRPSALFISRDQTGFVCPDITTGCYGYNVAIHFFQQWVFSSFICTGAVFQLAYQQAASVCNSQDTIAAPNLTYHTYKHTQTHTHTRRAI